MNRKIVLIASLVAGVLAALLTSVYISSKEDEVRAQKAKFNKENEQIETFRFRREMYEGAVIAEADIEPCKYFKRHGEDLVTPGSERKLIGKKTSCHVSAGQPIRWPYVEGGKLEAKGLSDSIEYKWDSEKPKSYRAMSINVTGASSVSGLIRKGDYVDVIGTFDFPDDQGKIRRGDPVTCTVLQRVQVLATGSDRPPERGLGATGAAAARSAGPYSLVTLSVTPREAEILAFAENIKGRLMLTLRNEKDRYVEPDLPVITFDEIRKEMSKLNEERNELVTRRRTP